MRAPDWDARLAAVLADAEAAGWAWDGATCLHMLVAAADAVAPCASAGLRAARMAGGEMPRARRPLLRALLRLGGLERAIEGCAAQCGFPEINPRFAASGDWGVAYHAGDASRPDLAEGVVKMDSCWVYRLPGDGVSRIPADVAPVARAWAVG